MLKIGEFSQLSQVSIKTLRYYDSIDLFKPDAIDSFTKHRYYTLQQLPQLHRIMALKGLGLSLEQIRLMEQDNVDENQIRGMLRLKEAELQQQVHEARQRLERVHFHLRMIETETDMSDMKVVMKELEPMEVIILQWHPNLSAMLESEVKAAVAAGQIRHTGKFMQIFDGEQMNDDWSNANYVLEVESSQPKQDVTLPTQGTFKRGHIPAVQAATIVVNGTVEDSREKRHTSLNRWAVEHGYQLCGESRVVYHRGPMHTKNKTEWILELQAVVKPRE